MKKTMNEKQIAAEKSVEFIEPGMVIGLGTGSTVAYLINALGKKVKKGLNINAVSTSAATTKLAEENGIEIKDLDNVDYIDITIDGADEVDLSLNGIKGGGGALLFEKIVANSSKRNIWIVDSTKMVEQLGSFPLPVEVVPFGKQQTFNLLNRRGYNPKFRIKENELFKTDSGNFIIDLHLKKIEDADKLNMELKLIPGIIETGLFIDIADVVITGRENKAEIIERKILKKKDQPQSD